MKIEQLKNCVFALASDSKVQASLYPDGTCKGDELVLDFDDSFRALKNEKISKDQSLALHKLDQLISSFSGEESGDMFLTDEALTEDSRWDEIRSEARKVIDSFEWQYETPKKNCATYVLIDETIKNK